MFFWATMTHFTSLGRACNIRLISSRLLYAERNLSGLFSHLRAAFGKLSSNDVETS